MDNGNNTPPRQNGELLFGIVAQADGSVGVQSTMNPRQALRLLIGVCEDLREAIARDAPASRIATVPGGVVRPLRG
jgi:hypothetical protein